jgi:hypothetical protein
MPADRYPLPKEGVLSLPPEVEATRADLRYWLENMLVHHAYSFEEAAVVTGWDVKTVQQVAQVAAFGHETLEPASKPGLKLLPYPGGRHPRIGYLDGAIAPQRGTKASIFAPWEGGGYAVLDVPEAVWEGDKLLYLAHTHIPTFWDQQNITLENVDWTRTETGLSLERTLPNNVSFGVNLTAGETTVDIELWLKNGTETAMKDLRAQVCLMLKGLAGFEAQTNENKTFADPVTTVGNADGTRWVLIAFDPVDRCWGNAKCPCAHVDPQIPDAAPGERQVVRGRIWFYEGKLIESQQTEAETWAAGAR